MTSRRRIEISNCSEFLRRTIDLVNPVLVVALGCVALAALEGIHPHRSHRETVLRKGNPVEWATSRSPVSSESPHTNTKDMARADC